MTEKREQSISIAEGVRLFSEGTRIHPPKNTQPHLFNSRVHLEMDPLHSVQPHLFPSRVRLEMDPLHSIQVSTTPLSMVTDIVEATLDVAAEIEEVVETGERKEERDLSPRAPRTPTLPKMRHVQTNQFASLAWSSSCC